MPATSTPPLAPIALVGIGCRFPGASGPAAFWDLLRDGRDAIREVPPERFDVDEFYDPRPGTPGKIATRWGGFLDAVDQFDAGFFGIAPREASRMDPQQRLLLEVAWEALADGGQVLTHFQPGETGVFVGALSTEYEDLLFDSPESVNVYSLVGSSRSVLAGRLSYALGVEGPSVTVDTACSSSLVALHLACQALRAGECRMALVGGVNLILEPKYSIGFSQARMLAPDGRCKAFDARANGFVRSDGVAVVVLKPLAAALAAGDPIYAVVRGSAVNNDGQSGGLLMTPSQQGQEAVLRAAYGAAGVVPGQVQYVEAHGTGTSAGDPIEAGALGTVLAEGRAPGTRCAIGSVKTNIGHTEGAAGLAGVIKVALSLQRRQLPPSLHCDEPNPAIPWDALPLTVQRELAPWPAHDGPALAGVNSFGISGTNAHVILEEAPDAGAAGEAAPDADPAAALLLPLSARTPEALAGVVRATRDWLGDPANEAVSLRDLGHTASRRRAHLDERLAVVAMSRAGLRDALDAAVRDEVRPGLVRGRQTSDHQRKVAFVFPGQGGQWAGMARDLLAREPVFRAALTACDAALRRYCEWSLLDEIAADADASRLGEIDVVQPAIFAVQVALAAQWRTWGIAPDAVVGHSMGEVAAAHVAGILSLDDAARIICLRSQLLRRTSGRGAMALVALSWEHAARALAGYEDRVAVAASNSPTLTVLSGDPAALEAIMAALQRQGVFCQLVRVDVASHSPQMDPLRPELLRLLDGIQPQAGHTAFASTVTLVRCAGPELDAAYWVSNLREPVRLAATVQQLVAEGYDTFVELSPHPTLIGAVQQMLQPLRGAGRALPSLRRQEDGRAVLLESLGALYTVGCPVAWDALYAGGRAVALPSYPWQRERYWFDDDTGGVAAAMPGQRGPARLGSGGMPLLGQHLAAAGEPGTHLWEMEIGIANLAYLTDHRVQGKAVLPGAAYVELALEATAQALGLGAHALEVMRFHQALVLPERGGVTMQVMLSAPTAERANVQIFSRMAGAGDSGAGSGGAVWTRHASGTVRLAAPTDEEVAQPDAMELAQLRARCAEAVSPGDHYATLAARELDYGPAFQGVGALWRGAGEALARVAVTEPIADRAGAYILHPALLDACFQTLVAALGSGADDADQATETYLPVAIERLRVYDAAVAERIAWCHAVKRDDTSGAGAPGGTAPESITGDLRVLDAAGRVLAEVVGLRAQRLAPDAPRAETARVEDWLYQVMWQESPPRPTDAARVANADAPGTWLLFADRLGVAAALRQQLEARGATCVLVARDDQHDPGAEHDGNGQGNGSNRRHPDDARLDPTDADAYTALLRRLAAGGQPALRGAVHLWSLDAPEPVADDLDRIQAAQDRGSVSLLYLAQALASAEPGAEQREGATPRLWVVTAGAQAVPGADVAENAGDDPLLTLAQTPMLGLARVVPYELPELRCARVDLSAAPTETEIAALAAALWSGDAEDEVALRGAARFVRRLAPYTPPDAPEAEAAASRLEIALPTTVPLGVASVRPGMLDQLALRLVERRAPSPGEVEVQVRAAGLNFIDLMRAMGIYPDQPAGAIPLGIECAGVVVAVGTDVADVRAGDAVVAITPASESCLRTYVTTKACLTFPIPEGMRFAQAAVQPMAYLTAWYALHHLGHMGAGERVLIHAAAGGVGLAALALAQRAGAEVFATAGSAEKRAYLAARGVQHLMDSRSLAFADEVLAATGGAGVDLVLNSLAGAAIPRSLATLGAYGRFLELGKSDIYQDRQLGLGVFRNNISFAAID
ncbi:MAG TPA: beta-ketoacyl synthase N-terminal-like domain-containing protein, partial [Ktedonobacterales bacterium]